LDIGLTPRSVKADGAPAAAFWALAGYPSRRIVAGLLGPLLLACPAERYQVAPVSPWDAGASDPSVLDPELEPTPLPDGGPSKTPELGSIVERSILVERSVVERGHPNPRKAGEGSPEK
jgi:hypothetical protein